MGRSRGPILVVEDNVETRQVLARILAIKGYVGLVAEDGVAGLRLLREREASLVILDLHLPGMDGWTFLHQLKEDPRLAPIPVIVYTSDAREVPGVAACVRKGRDDPDVLLDAIARCLER